MLKFRRKKFLKTFIPRISTFKVNSYMLITFKSPVVLKENCSVKTMMTYKWFVFALTKYLTRKWREDEFLMSGRATHSFNNNLVQTLHSSHLLTCRHNAREQKWANCIFQLKIKSEKKLVFGLTSYSSIDSKFIGFRDLNLLVQRITLECVQ